MKGRGIAIAALLLALLAGGYLYSRMRGLQQAAVKWDGPVPEVASENIRKEGDLTRVEMTSRIDAPIDAVFAAFEAPD